MKGIYLDNSVTTRPSLAAVSRMMHYFSHDWGVYSQPHKAGQDLESAISESYKSLYSLFGASFEDTIVFTGSGAEAVNQVILGAYFQITVPTGKNHFIVGKSDEAPGIMSVSRLEELGCLGTSLSLNEEGVMTPQKVIEALSPRTALVSLSWGNGLTGVVQPVREISKILKERGVKFHLEASHVLGRLYFDLHDIGADYITFGGDLIHGPKSSGALWMKSGEKIPSFILGGIEQGGFRAGPLDTASLVGLGEAAKEALEGRDFVATEVARLRAKFEKSLLKAIPEAKILFKRSERLPHISLAIFPGCTSEALLFELNRLNLFACMGGGSLQQIGYVLQAAGIKAEEALSALSFSLSRDTTDEEIDRAVEIIQESVKKLAKFSRDL